jgi:hypothetical protein
MNSALKVCCIALAVFITAPLVSAQVLLANPGPANNGGSAAWAMFLNLIAGPQPINVTDMTTASTAAANATYSVEIFTRTGNALGGPVGSGPGSSSAGWTSLGTAPVTQGPAASGVSLLFTIPTIHINAGDTVGVAIRFNTVGPRYFGTGTPPYETYSNANLTLVTGDGRSAPFTTTGTWFASRALVGEIHYGSGVTLSHDIGVSSLTKRFPTAAPSQLMGVQRVHPPESKGDVAGVSNASNDADASMDNTVVYPSSPSLTTKFALADTVGFRAIITNYGSSTEPTHQLGWRIDGVNQTTISRNTPLAPGANDTVLFQWNQAVTGVHTLRAWTIIPVDSNHANDTATLAFSVGRVQGDTLYNFTVGSSHLILGVAKIPTNKLVITSGGQSNALTTDNKFLVMSLRGAWLDTTHFEINNTAGQGFGFRDLAWDGRWLLTSDDTRIRRIDTATFTEILPAITNSTNNPHRGIATNGPNRIYTTNFTTGPLALIDSTGALVRSIGIPSVAPYGVAFDKWTSRSKAFLWYAQPSAAGQIKLSKVDTSTGALIATYDYSSAFPAAASSGGLDIVNNDPEYPGSVVAFMATQFGPGGAITAIYLGQDSSTVGVDEQSNPIPDKFTLSQNYPNPFNPSTTVHYALPAESHVTLALYNVLGQQVARLRDEIQGPGTYDAVWDGTNVAGNQLASGVYFYRLDAKPVNGSTFTSLKKMILLK